MPVYEFHCKSKNGCGKWTDKKATITNIPVSTKCGFCGKKAVKGVKTPPNLAIPEHHRADYKL